MKHCCCCCCCCSHSACSTCTLMPSRFISQNVGLVQLKLTSRVIPTIHVLRYTDLSRLHFSSQLERIKPVSGKFRYTSNAGSCAMINDNTYHIAVPSRSSHRYQITTVCSPVIMYIQWLLVYATRTVHILKVTYSGQHWGKIWCIQFPRYKLLIHWFILWN